MVNAYNLGWYDYGSRYYNPALGLFNSVDPQATRGYGLYPYAYCANNPILYIDPNGEWFGIDDAIFAAIGGIVNLSLNWGNIEGFWDGFSTFITGAAGGAVVSANNSVVAQTDANFEGIEDVNWVEVGKQSLVGAASGAAGSGAGYAASKMSFLVNGVSRPMLRSAVVSPLAAGAGHVAGGTTANLLAGQNLGDAFMNSFDGIGQSMVVGGVLGITTTAAVSYINGINPLTGNELTRMQFGNNENQVRHTFRHTDDLGLDRAIVQSAIEAHVKTISSFIAPGHPFNQVINVGGQNIQYTAYKLPSGIINIERIHGVN